MASSSGGSVLTWRFDQPFPEALTNTGPFDEAKGFYQSTLNGNVHFNWDCLGHAGNVGRNGPDGAMEVVLQPRNVPANAAGENRDFNYRCEFFLGAFHAPGDEVGVEKWMGYSMYVPPDWMPDQVDESVAQIHAGVAKPRMLFVMEGTTLDFFHRGSLTCGSDADANTRYPLITVSAGNWYDIVVRVVAADSTDTSQGAIQVWVNQTLQVDLAGIATVYDCSPQVGTLKMGVYKYNWHLATNAASLPNVEASENAGAETRHYYYDNVSIYLGPDGFGRVDPARLLPADP